MKYPADIRRAMIVTAAVEVANDMGIANVTRHSVAVRAGISASTVRSYFPRLTDLLQAVMGDTRTSGAARRIGEGMGL